MFLAVIANIANFHELSNPFIAFVAQFSGFSDRSSL